MIDDREIKAAIILKLYKRGKWGGSHTSFDNLKKGFKVQELGKEGLKRIERLGKDLIREGLLISKPTRYGLEVSLNPRQSEKIISMMKDVFGEI